jgi:predicted small metal-binding protein
MKPDFVHNWYTRVMKTITCQDCEKKFQADTKEEILGYLYDHYMKDHTEIITTVDEEGKKSWMAQFEKDWAQASEQ